MTHQILSTRTSGTVPATPTMSGLLQRACDCGGPSGVSGKCAGCEAEENLGFQTKLSVNTPGDEYEQEADRIADEVIAGRQVSEITPLGSGGAASLRTQETVSEEDEEPLQTKREAIQRQEEEEEEEETLQTKPDSAGTRAHSAVPAAAAAVSSGGRPLPAAARDFFEPRFGRDLSHVRIHTDAEAGSAAREIGARAYTLRNHIAFAPGQFDPVSSSGRHLMAHELTHTMQQGSAGALRRVPDGMAFDDDDFGRRNPFAPRHMDDPRGPGQSTLTYAQSQELSRCIEVMGDSDVARAECANLVLGTPIPEWKSVEGISSPVPFRAEVSDEGVATTRIGRVSLTIRPDAHSDDASMENRAETTINFPPLAEGENLVDFETQNGRITSFTFNQDLNSLTIQTTYGPGASPSGTSGYGRGTTEADRSTGRTSLGFHEGEHGRDFINFLRENPYPRFEGRIGQSHAVFVNHVNRFRDAVQSYIRRMTRESLHDTDCVGETTIDESNLANGEITHHCQGAPPQP